MPDPSLFERKRPFSWTQLVTTAQNVLLGVATNMTDVRVTMKPDVSALTDTSACALPAAVFVELAPRVRRLAARWVGENLADDVVQETFLRAWRAYDRYVDEGKAWPWIRSIARHVCSDMARRSRSQAAIVERVSFCHRRGSADDTLAAVVARSAGTEVRAALERLEARQRHVLLLRDLHGQSTRETAAALGMTTEAVKATLKRARAAFRATYLGLAESRYVGGLIAGLGTMRRSFRRATSAVATPANAVLFGTVAVATTLSLHLSEHRENDEIAHDEPIANWKAPVRSAPTAIRSQPRSSGAQPPPARSASPAQSTETPRVLVPTEESTPRGVRLLVDELTTKLDEWDIPDTPVEPDAGMLPQSIGIQTELGESCDLGSALGSGVHSALVENSAAADSVEEACDRLEGQTLEVPLPATEGAVPSSPADEGGPVAPGTTELGPVVVITRDRTADAVAAPQSETPELQAA